MKVKTQTFKFRDVYASASMVEYAVGQSYMFGEIQWDLPDLVKSLYVCSKTSLLHYFIYTSISQSDTEEYRDNSDMYYNERVEREVEQIFSEYGIAISPFANFDDSLEYASDEPGIDNDPFFRWFLHERNKFEQLWELMTGEVFHLLFANRSILLQFNRSLAEFLKTGAVAIPSEYLDAKGVIKRNTIPNWAKKAVFYRDQGRCVFCQRDLSGLLSTDRILHYDHMVPLNLWGTNDPCNIQLLCGECNLKKSGAIIETGTRYAPWWVD